MSKVEVNQISSQCGSTLTIGQSGDTVTLAAGATQTGFGRTGTVDWDTTAKTASFTAVSGNGYFVNTTSGAITVTLPAGSAGSIVSLKDYASTWQTNNVTVTPNGTDKINGYNVNATLNTQDQSVTLVYVDSTKGWRAVQDSTSDVTGKSFIVATGGTITCCGDYKIHTFTGPGTFTVCSVGSPAGSDEVSYMVVAGGGGGGYRYGGGGGAGGYREGGVTCKSPWTKSPLATTGLPVTATSYPITVGGGGAGGTAPECTPAHQGVPGSNTTFSSITSAGGGGGGGSNVLFYGDNGGSGGGGKSGCAPGCYQQGNTPPVSPPQGQPGGCSQTSGGGGATAAGGTWSGTPSNPNADGGAGATTSISGSSSSYAGGGGGGGYPDTPSCNASDGGLGGGGDGGTAPSKNGQAGTANTGGGAGGGAGESPNGDGGAGGSGIVIIRYKFQ